MSTIAECPSCQQKNRVPSHRAAIEARCGRCGTRLSPSFDALSVDEAGAGTPSLVRLERGDLERDWSRLQERRGVSYLLLDCSGSMGGEKLLQAKDGAVRYAERAIEHGHSVGLVAFATGAALILVAVENRDAIRAAVDGLSAGGTTAMHRGLAAGIEALPAQSGPRSLVVVTDGRPNDRDATLREAARAKATGITVITIGTDDADAALLRQLSSEPAMSIQAATDCLSDAMADVAFLLPGGCHSK